MELEPRIPLDPLLKETALFVCTIQQCSTSIIQRKFGVGYNRATRIVDQLEAIEVVGKSKGSFDREVLFLDCPDIDGLIEKYIADMQNEAPDGYEDDEISIQQMDKVKLDGIDFYISKMCPSNYISYIEKDVDRNCFIGEIGNCGISKKRVIESQYSRILKYRIEMQFLNWQKLEERKLELGENRYKRISYGIEYFDAERFARDLDARSKHDLEAIASILPDCMTQQNSLDLEEIFKCPKNNKPKPLPLFDKAMTGWDKEHILELDEIPEEPIPPLKESYLPQLSWKDSFWGRKKKKEQQACDEYKEAYKEYENALEKWNEEVEKIKKASALKKEEHESARNAAMRSFREKDARKQDEWEKWDKMCRDSVKVCEEEKERFNEKYFAKEKGAIEDYCSIVLDKSAYNYPVAKEFVIEFQDNGLLVIEYRLPDISDLPKYKECKYVSREARPKAVSQTELNKIYDKMLYDISLRCIYELFDTDCARAVSAICFNGWVRTIDKATGNNVTNCILSVQVEKNEFARFDLRNVDSKLCFKSLKGVSANKLCQLTPIKPILNIKKEDKRFIESKNVIKNVNNSINLASMNWEDFEFLVREIFEKEFSANGGEVKITQASRDGGVDAIAFDPDPIRGGKIVIQAKRYTNTVSVSAVRDLWGTVMNEGAMKGLLVTTSDFGVDSYNFVKDKPITLINGANLLFLLEKHGTHAKIDINKARIKNQMN